MPSDGYGESLPVGAMNSDAYGENPYSITSAPFRVRSRWAKQAWRTRQKHAISDLVECHRQLGAAGKKFSRPRRAAPHRRRYSRSPEQRSYSTVQRRYSAFSRRSPEEKMAAYGYGHTPSESDYEYKSPFGPEPASPILQAERILRPVLRPDFSVAPKRLWLPGEKLPVANNPELQIVHNPCGRRRRKYVSGAAFSLRHRRGTRKMRRKARNLPLTVKIGGKRHTARVFIGKMRKRGLSMKAAWRVWRKKSKYHGYSGGGLAGRKSRKSKRGRRKYGRRASRRYSRKSRKHSKRRRSRNAWKGAPRRHAKAARKGWRRRRARKAHRYSRKRSRKVRKYSRRRKSRKTRKTHKYSRRRRSWKVRAIKYRSRKKILARAKRRYSAFKKLSPEAQASAYGMNPRRRRRRRR